MLRVELEENEVERVARLGYQGLGEEEMDWEEEGEEMGFRLLVQEI